jgi:hypothetical protein
MNEQRSLAPSFYPNPWLEMLNSFFRVLFVHRLVLLGRLHLTGSCPPRRYVASGPLVRSSYKAGEFFMKNLLKEAPANGAKPV